MFCSAHAELGMEQFLAGLRIRLRRALRESAPCVALDGYLFQKEGGRQSDQGLKGFHLAKGGELDGILWYDHACQALISQRRRHAHLQLV